MSVGGVEDVGNAVYIHVHCLGSASSVAMNLSGCEQHTRTETSAHDRVGRASSLARTTKTWPQGDSGPIVTDGAAVSSMAHRICGCTQHANSTAAGRA